MEDLIPTEYYLSQNYPNPFKEKTTIKYCLPEKVKVRIKVFDHEGKMVNELINQEQDEGTYQVEFNGSDLKRGEYTYLIEAGSCVIRKKMILTG